MNTKTLLVGLTLTGSLATVPAAYAGPPVTKALGNHVYIGAKAGIVVPDFTGADSAYNLGVYGGYNLFGKDASRAANLGGGTLSIEGELTLSAIDGDAGLYGDWGITTLAAYGAYRFPLTDYFYLKGKAGLRWQDIDTDLPVSWGGTDTGASFGLGAGWRLGTGTLEAEITLVESDVTMFSLGYLF